MKVRARGEELGESAQMASRYAVSPSGATQVPTNYSSGEGVSDDKRVVGTPFREENLTRAGGVSISTLA